MIPSPDENDLMLDLGKEYLLADRDGIRRAIIRRCAKAEYELEFKKVQEEIATQLRWEPMTHRHTLPGTPTLLPSCNCAHLSPVPAGLTCGHCGGIT